MVFVGVGEFLRALIVAEVRGGAPGAGFAGSGCFCVVRVRVWGLRTERCPSWGTGLRVGVLVGWCFGVEVGEWLVWAVGRVYRDSLFGELLFGF